LSAARVLIVDADPRAAERLASTLRDGGHRPVVSGADEAPSRIHDDAFDLVLLDHDSGASSLRRLKQQSPSTLIALTGSGEDAQAVIEAFRGGAWDFVLEPFEPARIGELAERAAALRQKGEQRRRLSEDLENERHRNEELRRRLADDQPFEKIIGTSVAMRNLADTLREIARTDSTVLLTGESGTGKGLAARAIHDASGRREAAFVEANCVVYSEGVLHSELFGHEKGAFTGAARQKKGRFEMAHGGTLFLDEIGDISPATQLMLLRVLQERTFERVGGEETLEADVRLIAATNSDLEAAMRRGAFRSDLFYRLNVIPVRLPALREHAEDLPVLAQHFLRQCASRLGREVSGFTDEVLEAIVRHTWPGNVRELENTIERMVVLCRSDRIGRDDLPPELRDGVRERNAPGTLQDMERQRIVEVLQESGGNKKLAATKLGIHRSTLYAKLKRHGLLDEAATGAERRESRQDTSHSETDLGIRRAV
jgi:two-component system response regulator HydG